MTEHDIENRLNELVPRGAPPELRDRVLSKLESASVGLSESKRDSWLDRASNCVLVATLLIAAFAWFGNVRSQQRLTTLLGKTSAQRRAEREVEAMQLHATEQQKQIIQEQLSSHLARVDRGAAANRTIDSFSYSKRFLLAEDESEEVEEDSEDRADPRGSSFNRRGDLQLEVVRTA